MSTEHVEDVDVKHVVEHVVVSRVKKGGEKEEKSHRLFAIWLLATLDRETKQPDSGRQLYQVETRIENSRVGTRDHVATQVPQNSVVGDRATSQRFVGKCGYSPPWSNLDRYPTVPDAGL